MSIWFVGAVLLAMLSQVCFSTVGAAITKILVPNPSYSYGSIYLDSAWHEHSLNLTR